MKDSESRGGLKKWIPGKGNLKMERLAFEGNLKDSDRGQGRTGLRAMQGAGERFEGGRARGKAVPGLGRQLWDRRG